MVKGVLVILVPAYLTQKNWRSHSTSTVISMIVAWLAAGSSRKCRFLTD